MKTKITLFVLGLLAVSTGAQSEWERAGALPHGIDMPSPRTEALPKSQIIQRDKIPTFRIIGTNIYNIQSDPHWEAIFKKVYEKRGDVLVLASIAPNPTYTAVKNYAGDALLDNQVELIAMRIGTYDFSGGPIALYDCGKPYIPPPLTPEQIVAAKANQELAAKAAAAKEYQAQANAVRWLQPQATNGDASAQCSLGQHYLAGQGCETNRTLAVYWLTQAASQGDIEASNKLANLKQ